MTILKNIHSTAEDYQQLTEFYAVYKDEWFSSIHVSLKQWFSANMSAPLGALLDLLQENVNDVAFDDIDQDIKVILQKNQFLTHFGYPAQRDNHTTTISYQKIKPEDSRYFHHYVQTQLFGRPELPERCQKPSLNCLLTPKFTAKLRTFTPAVSFSQKKAKLSFVLSIRVLAFKAA